MKRVLMADKALIMFRLNKTSILKNRASLWNFLEKKIQMVFCLIRFK